MLYSNITDSVSIPEHCEIPDKIKGTPLGDVEYGYKPIIDAGCNHHFAYPNLEIEFAIECTAKESQPISCGVVGYLKISPNIISKLNKITFVRAENCIELFISLLIAF